MLPPPLSTVPDELLRGVLRSWRLIVVATLVGALVGTIFTAAAPRRYESTLLIQENPRDQPLPLPLNAPEPETFGEAVTRALSSSAVVSAASRSSGGSSTPDELARSIMATDGGKGGTTPVTAQAGSTREASRRVTAVVRAFLERSRRTHQRLIDRSVAQVQGEIDRSSQGAKGRARVKRLRDRQAQLREHTPESLAFFRLVRGARANPAPVFPRAATVMPIAIGGGAAVGLILAIGRSARRIRRTRVDRHVVLASPTAA